LRAVSHCLSLGLSGDYTAYTLRTCIHPYPTHELLQTYTPTHNQSYKRTYTIHTYPTPTYLPYIPTLPVPTYKTLHTYPIPTPALFLQLLHPTLHACPIITHQLQEQAVTWCGCVLPVMEYYVLRNLLAKSLHLNLISLLRASCRRKGC